MSDIGATHSEAFMKVRLSFCPTIAGTVLVSIAAANPIDGTFFLLAGLPLTWLGWGMAVWGA